MNVLQDTWRSVPADAHRAAQTELEDRVHTAVLQPRLSSREVCLFIFYIACFGYILWSVLFILHVLVASVNLSWRDSALFPFY